MPLHDAAFHGQFDNVKQLLEMGAPHLPRSSYGETPAKLARTSGHPLIAEYLDKYTPAAPTVHKHEWYHGTLNRNESGKILRQFIKTMKDNSKFDLNVHHEQNAGSDDEEDGIVSIINYFSGMQIEQCNQTMQLNNVSNVFFRLVLVHF